MGHEYLCIFIAMHRGDADAEQDVQHRPQQDQGVKQTLAHVTRPNARA